MLMQCGSSSQVQPAAWSLRPESSLALQCNPSWQRKVCDSGQHLLTDTALNPQPLSLQWQASEHSCHPCTQRGRLSPPCPPIMSRQQAAGGKPVTRAALHAGELLSIASDGVEMIPAPAILGQLAVMAKEMPRAGHRQETLRSIAHSSMWRLDMSDLEHVRPILPSAC